MSRPACVRSIAPITFRNFAQKFIILLSAAFLLLVLEM